MPGASLLTLLDDITSVLDDVALMTKVAAKKTAGVLGDDLALNAQQVSGVVAERELPVVWGVAKGSFINKAILIPAALLISTFVPWLILPLLMVGGAYLCFEGAEKLLHKFVPAHDLPNAEDSTSPSAARSGDASAPDIVPDVVPDVVPGAGFDAGVDVAALEQEKIKGAIRTDFVLSAEIIVIALGSVPEGSSFAIRAAMLCLIGVVMTIGVYGLVAGIVKLDDAGFYLRRQCREGSLGYRLGGGLLGAAPILMRLLTVVGTVAMFMVGGGILAHGLPVFHIVSEMLSPLPLGALLEAFANALFGVIAGALVLGALRMFSALRQALFSR